MRVPLEWLHEYCRPELDADALGERLDMSGTAVEGIEHHGVAELDHFVVGKVLEAGPHPNADRLRRCLVDTGDGQPSQIVCGAPNVAAGQTVAVATPGAVMPDGTTLRKAKLRGLESNGMILAEDELAIGPDHAEIIVLDDDQLAAGSPLADVLPISTDVIELEITQNRPDCLGIYGVAREVHAATGAPLREPPWSEDPGTAGDVAGIEITVECPDLCPRFTARVFEDVKIGPSPAWLKARLMAAGQRPISNVVDITNYVMLLTGQPLHAFDLDRVAGRQLTIRRAAPGETVDTLDGQTRTLDDQMVLIADDDGPTSIAGVMGGLRSEVQDDTTRVLMEAANWDGPNIHRTSLRLGLRSEASGRFEKQIQPEQALEAQAVAAALMIELCGARLAPGTIDVGGPGPEPLTIRLRDARVSGLLGAPIPRDRCAEILRALEFVTADAPDGLDATVPTFRRGDVTREADLIEEVARLDGLEKLPATLPSRHGASGRLTAAAADASRCRRRARRPGAARDRRLELRRARPRPAAAAATTTVRSSSRTRCRPSSRSCARRCWARCSTSPVATARTARPRCVCSRPGPCTCPTGEGELPTEPHHVGALLIGPVRPATWRDPDPRRSTSSRPRACSAGLLGGLRARWTVEPATEPFLHPGRAARILVDGKPAGWLGEIHPLVAAEWDIEDTVAAFELDLDAVPLPETPLYVDVTSFPEVREDLAVVVADDVAAADVLEVVRRAGAPLLARVSVFDVYRDAERLGAGNVSLALRLSYRAPDRTLTDEEVAARRARISKALEDELGGRVRAA